MNDIQYLLRRMADSANAAQAHYQIWFTLRGDGKALPGHLDDMNDYRYVDFFHANNAGHYKLMYIELGCLFDTDSRSASFRNLKTSLKERGYDLIIEKIDNALSKYKQLVSSILTIRSKLIAHKEIGAESEDIHKNNGIIPNQVKQLLSSICSLINEIDSELFGNNGVLLASKSDRYERATFSLLEVLRNGRL